MHCKLLVGPLSQPAMRKFPAQQMSYLRQQHTYELILLFALCEWIKEQQRRTVMEEEEMASRRRWHWAEQINKNKRKFKWKNLVRHKKRNAGKQTEWRTWTGAKTKPIWSY